MSGEVGVGHLAEMGILPRESVSELVEVGFADQNGTELMESLDDVTGLSCLSTRKIATGPGNLARDVEKILRGIGHAL